MVAGGGALVAEARLNTAIKAGHDALEMIKFFEQEAAFSIGYRAVKARRRGGVRELHDVELYEVSPVLHGAHPDARLIGVKGGRPPGVEYKATTGVLPARRRAGMPTAAPCSVCGRPAAAVVPGGLRAGETLICPRCVEVADDDTSTDTSTDTAVLDADDIAAAYRLTEDDAELTSEEEYDEALGADVEWDLLADGTLTRTADRGPPQRPRVGTTVTAAMRYPDRGRRGHTRSHPVALLTG